MIPNYHFQDFDVLTERLNEVQNDLLISKVFKSIWTVNEFQTPLSYIGSFENFPSR